MGVTFCALTFVVSTTLSCFCLGNFFSSDVRSLPGQAHIFTSNESLPSTSPLLTSQNFDYFLS